MQDTRLLFNIDMVLNEPAWGNVMIKKINKNQLRLGMYIHDIQCDWMMDTSICKKTMLRKEADLAWILDSSAATVYIDTLKGLDVSGGLGAEDAFPACLAAGLDAGPDPDGPAAPQAPTSYWEEVVFAREIKREASQAIHSLLTDVRMGRAVQVDQLRPVVTQITDSILRNPGALVSLCRLREADAYTYQHSLGVCALLVMFCHHLGLDRATLQEVAIGGLLHDIGKMRVPDHILNKPGKLTAAEYATMQDHVLLGLETLGRTPGISAPVLQVTGEHHERYDGSGYPGGLSGLGISPLGRISAIVDVYDAVTSTRVYHAGIEPSEALRRLYLRSPGDFDPDLVQHFIRAIGIYPVGSMVRLESNRLAVVLEHNRARALQPKVRIVYDIGRGRTLSPLDLDLAAPAAAGDGILGPERPAAWNLEPQALLGLA
jgi:putative nucleotidyltransferase with HDIG domain